MTTEDFTHVGNLIGGVLVKRVVATVALKVDSGVWIDPKGNRYSLKDGYSTDYDWALLNLDLDSIEPI